MDKPEALRLADAMSLAFPGNLGIDMAAAELRRLHALLEAEQALLQRVIYPELQRLRAQRDALLETLKYIAKQFRQHGRQHWPEAVAARLAIKAVEGEDK